MTDPAKSISSWSPVIVRGALWVLISMLTDFQHHMHDLTPEKLALMTLPNYLEIIGGTILAGAIALRLFLDGTVARHQHNLQVEGKVPPTATPV
jgi:hypothetical protein